VTTKPRTVHLYPVPGVFVDPYPSEECDVPPEVAEFLLAHIPPPFTTEPPDKTEEPSE
jgi:hypothetical protein